MNASDISPAVSSAIAFPLNGAGTSVGYVRIDFSHSQGDLDLAVYQSDGTTEVGFSDSRLLKGCIGKVLSSEIPSG